MDIGIVPKAGHFDAVAAQHFNGLIGAGGAADVQKGLHTHSPIHNFS
jgi:hypothetical protein